MNLNELKPLWQSYQEQVDEQHHWSEAQLLDLLEEGKPSYPWYRRSQRTLLNVCVCLLFMAITGC